jgi:3-hydroxyisobutyryl-CoA hydrolase
MYCKYIYIYIILSVLLLFIVFRLAGLGTHFVLSSRLEELEEHMTKEQDLSLDKIDTIIQEYSVTESHKPQDYTLNKETRSIIDR